MSQNADYERPHFPRRLDGVVEFEAQVREAVSAKNEMAAAISRALEVTGGDKDAVRQEFERLLDQAHIDRSEDYA